MKKLISNLIVLWMLYSPLGELKNFQSADSKEKPKKDYHAERFIKELEKERQNKISYDGGLEITLLGENKKVKIPTWRDLHVTKPQMCAEYARKLTLQFGYQLERGGDSWDLHKKNSSMDFSEEHLVPGYLVTFYNENSGERRRNRIATHTAVYLGEDIIGNKYFAEQRGSKTKISTEEEMKKDGIHPRKIIKTEKINSN